MIRIIYQSDCNLSGMSFFLAFISIRLVVLNCDNILLTTPWADSTVYPDILTNIAEHLNTDHTVTLLSLEKQDKPRIDKVVYVSPGEVPGLQPVTDLHVAAELTGALGSSELDAVITDSVVGSQEVLDKTMEQLKLRFDYYLSKEFRDVLTTGNFSLIIAEETAVHPICLSIKMISQESAGFVEPVLITVLSIADHHRSRIEQNLPTLLFSEHGQFLSPLNDQPPSFYTRLMMIKRLALFVLKVVPRINEMFEKPLTGVGLTSLTDLDHMTSLYFVNDHPALSFPNLNPPNSIDIASLNHRQPKPINNILSSFIDQCKSKVILVEFDPIVYNTTLTIGGAILGHTVITKMVDEGYCIITSYIPVSLLKGNVVKYDRSTRLHDILGSGKIDVFVSQCGNAQRILGALYHVPMVCVPLFADQYSNSANVQRNGFGLILERDSADSILDKIAMIHLDEEVIKRRLHRASSAVLNDIRGSGDAVKYLTQYLIEHGNMDFLKNKLILEQSGVEIYNLDIGFLIVVVIVSFVYVLFRLVGYCWYRLFSEDNMAKLNKIYRRKKKKLMLKTFVTLLTWKRKYNRWRRGSVKDD